MKNGDGRAISYDEWLHERYARRISGLTLALAYNLAIPLALGFLGFIVGACHVWQVLGVPPPNSFFSAPVQPLEASSLWLLRAAWLGTLGAPAWVLYAIGKDPAPSAHSILTVLGIGFIMAFMLAVHGFFDCGLLGIALLPNLVVYGVAWISVRRVAP